MFCKQCEEKILSWSDGEKVNIEEIDEMRLKFQDY